MNVYVSVGVYNAEQEEFVKHVEDRLRVEGLVPQTVGRNVFTADSPFLAVNELMDKCRGVVIIALERLHIESGIEKSGGPDQAPPQAPAPARSARRSRSARSSFPDYAPRPRSARKAAANSANRPSSSASRTWRIRST